MIRITTLGDVLVTRGAAEESIEALAHHQKRLAILVYLALEADSQPVSRDRLEALFWPDAERERAQAALRQSLFVLRQQLGSDCFREEAGQRLGIHEAMVWCDALVFQRLVAQGRLVEAMEVYGGPFLGGHQFPGVSDGFERWSHVKRTSLERSMLSSAARLSQDAESDGDMARAAKWVRRAAALAPGDETPVWRLVHLLRRQDHPAEALEACEDFIARSWSRFGKAPSPQLEGLALALRNGTGPSLFLREGEYGEDESTLPSLGAHGRRCGERELLRANALFVLGKYLQAEEVLTGLLSYPGIGPLLHAEATLRLSEVYDRLGRRQAAAERLAEFLAVLDDLGAPHAGLVGEIRRRLECLS